ncbi:MAG TPA: hypothetical protein PKM57_16550 [Kiritimatiellia bacterium]|nr:hypothetical protein [Kiritimatiellia bacterium]HPS08156.1 hypothetical protein [Kiritimatiellia bacterium]
MRDSVTGMKRLFASVCVLCGLALGGCAGWGVHAPEGGWACRCGRIVPVTRGTGNDTEAAWSPDGTRIAFQTDREGDLDIAVADLASGAVTPLVAGEGQACYPAWTPDGAVVYAFGRHEGTATQAAAAKADCGYGLRLWKPGGGRVLTQGYWRDYTPSVTAAGDAVYYASTCGEAGDGVALWRMGLSPGVAGERLLRLDGDAGGMVQPSLSPDGRILLWAQLNNFRQNWRLCAALKTNLSDSVFLTPPEMGAYAPRWSPDGGRVAFTGFRRGDPGWGVYLLEPRSGALSRLETGAGNSRSPAWSPDGTELVFENNRTGSCKLYRTRVSCGGKPAARTKTEESRVDARLVRKEGAAELVSGNGTHVAGAVAPGQEALSFDRPGGLDFGAGSFFVRLTLTVSAREGGARIAAVGHYAEHAMGWQVYLSDEHRIWFHARDPKGVFIGAESDAPVALGRPVQVLGIRDADGTVRLYVDGKPQKRRGAGATLVYGPALKLCLGQQWNGGMRLNGRVTDFACGRGYPAGVPQLMTRERLFEEVAP